MHGLTRDKPFLRGLFAMCMLLSLFFSSPGYGESPESSKDVEVSTQELKELVDLLENPDRRNAFIRDLKNLIHLRQTAGREAKERAIPLEGKGREPLVMGRVFVRFESSFTRVLDGAISTASLVASIPAGFKRGKSFLSKPENRSRVLMLVVQISGSIAIALIVGLLLRRYILPGKDRKRSLAQRLIQGFFRIVLSVVPYGALLISLFVLIQVIPSFAIGHTLSLFIFSLVFLYRLTIGIFGGLLAPDEAEMRVLPLGDEYANYFWVWAVRFTKYAAFYFLVTGTLLITEIPLLSLSFIRGVLLFVFPVMISVFAMQIAREIRMRYGDVRGGEKYRGVGFHEIRGMAARYWPIPVLISSWIIFLFLIVRYEKGFSYFVEGTLWTAVAIVAIFVALKLLDWLFDRLFAVNERIKARFPGLEQKTNRYIRITRHFMALIILIFGIGAVVQVWGIPVSLFIASRTGSTVLLRSIAIFITLGVAIAIIEISQFVSQYLLQEPRGRKLSKKRKTLLPLINTTIKIGVAFIGGIVILDQLGVNTRPILAGAGIVGLAVGFGAQTLVKDVINGLFILLQDLIAVGDVAVLGDKGGLVEAVGIRTVTLRDLSGNVHVIPNSSIETVTNMTKGYSMYVFDVGVAYREDVDRVMDVLREIGEEMQNDPEYRKDILEPIEILGLDQFADSAVVIKARIKTKPIRQWAVGREFNRRMKKAFDELGIEIPFPHRTVYMGEPKEGPAPALQIKLQETNPSPSGKSE